MAPWWDFSAANPVEVISVLTAKEFLNFRQLSVFGLIVWFVVTNGWRAEWELFIYADDRTKCACACAAGGDVFSNAMLSYETICVYQRKLFDGSPQKGLIFYSKDHVDLCRSWFPGVKFWCLLTNNISFLLPQKGSETCNNWRRCPPAAYVRYGNRIYE